MRSKRIINSIITCINSNINKILEYSKENSDYSYSKGGNNDDEKEEKKN